MSITATSPITTVICDVGGVLLTNGWDHTGRNAVLAHFGLDNPKDKAAFEHRHEVANDPWEKGLTTVEEYLDATVFYEPRSFTPADFFEQMKAQSIELPNGGLRILRQMASSGAVDLAILNNEARELNDYRLSEFNLLAPFRCFFSSCYVGLRKPDPGIYKRALDILQRAPQEIAFIDDRAENVAPAVALGIHGIQFKDPAQLTRELDALGIAVAV